MLTIGEREIFGRKLGEGSGLAIESKRVKNGSNSGGDAVTNRHHHRYYQPWCEYRVEKSLDTARKRTCATCLIGVIESLHCGIEVGILE